jgi:cytidine deaminase
MQLEGANRERLFNASVEASLNAYCPYSKFRVGAALLLIQRDGFEKMMVTGCNVENASYGLCICAERSAMCKAISMGILSKLNQDTAMYIAVYS